MFLLWPSPFFGQESDAAQPVWSDDFAQSAASARESDRLLLVNFTGSDWCVWCHRLRDEVFNTTPFANYAQEALVLVEVDFPRTKALPEAVQQRNRALADKYHVTGYPTVLLLKPDGEEVGRVGYMEGGPKTFVRELKRLNNRPAKK